MPAPTPLSQAKKALDELGVPWRGLDKDELSDALQHAHVKAARGRFIRAAQGAVASAGEVELKIHGELHNIELLLDELAMTPRTRGPAVSSGLEADSWVEQR